MNTRQNGGHLTQNIFFWIVILVIFIPNYGPIDNKPTLAEIITSCQTVDKLSSAKSTNPYIYTSYDLDELVSMTLVKGKYGLV